MSKEKLEDYLKRLIQADSASEVVMQRLTELDRELEELILCVEEPKKRKQQYESSRKSLEELIEKSSYNKQMAKYDYPAKLLKGDIDLGSSRQLDAIRELSVTLDKDSAIPPDIVDITRALKLFFEEFFSRSETPPEVDVKAEAELKHFWESDDKGAWPLYQTYLDYNDVLDQADEMKESIEKLHNEKPDFYKDVNARKLLEARSFELKEHLLKNTDWEFKHKTILERFFCIEEDVSLLVLCADIIDTDCEGLEENFLDEQLQDEFRGVILQQILEQKEEEELRSLLTTALNNNHDKLLSVLINLIGFDQSYFYKALAQKGVKPEVFKKILDSLFLPHSPQGSYGIDGTYAERLMNEHKELPKNVIQTLQKAMPRGFDGHPLSGYFQFIDTINQEVKKQHEKKRQLDEKMEKDKVYCEHILNMSDMETIRFIVFTYIFDCIKGGIFPAKIGMSRKRIRECLQKQFEFENACGRNKNIMDQIIHLWQTQPNLQLNNG